MFAKKILVSALLAVGTLGATVMPLPSVAAVYVTVAPPAERVEVVPAPRRGYVWNPGYWNYRGNRHVWVKGNWVRERRGYSYEPNRWVERDGRWELQRSRWARGDRDGDGIPNGRDRHPNDPNRR